MPARLKSRSARSSTTSGRFATVSGASHSPHCPSCPPIGPSCSRAEFCHFHHGLLGYWRGRRQRLAVYLAYLLGSVSADTRQSIVELAFVVRAHLPSSTPEPA